MSKTNLPGFLAEASLVSTLGTYRINTNFDRLESEGVIPQFRFQFPGDPDVGAYLRCKSNGGGELVCRFFGGLPPFTIGGLLI